MYRAGIEYILGIRVQGDHLVINPKIPREWPGFSAAYRHGGSVYRIEVENPGKTGEGVERVDLDGAALPPDGMIPLVDDGRERLIRVVLKS